MIQFENQPLRLVDLYKTMYEPLKLAGKSESIRKQYGYAIRRFTIYMGHQPTIVDLNDETVTAFLGKLASRYAPRTVNNTRGYLLSLWRFANRKGVVAIGPDVMPVAEPESIPLAFTLDELKQLYKSAGKRSSLWEAKLRSIYDTGERITAVLRWRWEHLDQSTGDIYAPASIRKGGTKAKVYRLRPKALSLILALPRLTEYIFRPHEKDLYYGFDQIAKKAGVQRGREWRFHAIRKSHASYLKLAGGDPSDSLGHANRTTTEKYLSPRILNETRHSDLLPE